MVLLICFKSIVYKSAYSCEWFPGITWWVSMHTVPVAPSKRSAIKGILTFTNGSRYSQSCLKTRLCVLYLYQMLSFWVFHVLRLFCWEQTTRHTKNHPSVMGDFYLLVTRRQTNKNGHLISNKMTCTTLINSTVVDTSKETKYHHQW